MLLTEDYFKDIEDDDIIVSDDVNVINDTTLEDFNTKNVSEFDQTIMFHIQYDEQSEIILNKTAYMLIQLLELYNIQHSDVCYFSNVPSDIMNISIEKHKNYVTFSNMSNKCNANYAYAFIYIKKPIFSNIKQAVHFIYRLLNISFNDNKNLLKIGQVTFINGVNEIFNISTLTFKILYLIKDEYYDIIQVFDNLLNQSAKNFVLTDNSLIGIIRWFFGRKTVTNFFNKIKNNKKYDFKPVDNDNPFAVGRL